jgi:hypothetical protein
VRSVCDAAPAVRDDVHGLDHPRRAFPGAIVVGGGSGRQPVGERDCADRGVRTVPRIAEVGGSAAVDEHVREAPAR